MNLTKNYTSSKPDHSIFGGLIFYSDFNTDYRGDIKDESNIAKRIMDDWKFDERCRKLGENNKKMKLNRKGTK